MGYGVLDTKEKHVPGTALLNADDPLAGLRAAGEDLDVSKLKYGKGKNSHVVLVPQPSDDPNDPLNWSQWQKWSCFLSMLFAVTLTGVAGPLLSAATLVIASDFNLTLAEAGQATAGWQIFGVAVSVPFWGPILQKFGRRLPFLVGTTLMAVGGIISAQASSHSMLIASRAIIGIGMGPAECLAGALIADIFFVHERGLPMALLNLAFVNGINLSPSLSGLVTARHGWRTAAWIFAAFAIACIFVQFFFQRETLFNRNARTHLHREDSTEAEKDNSANSPATKVSALPSGQREHISYVQALKLWSGVYETKATFFQMIYRPFLLIFSPIVWYAFLVYGGSITFIVLVAVSSSFIFSGPPYNFGPEQSGYIWFGSLVGTTIAVLIAGKLSDMVSKGLAHRNGGVYESEFRLPLMVLYALPAGFGYLGWGISVQNLQPWIAPVVSFALIGMGTTFALTLSTAYLVDAFGGASTSALASMMTIKNFVSFSATYWAGPWVQNHSILSVFGAIAGFHFAVGLLTIPMYIFGKHVRLFTSKYVRFQDESLTAH